MTTPKDDAAHIGGARAARVLAVGGIAATTAAVLVVGVLHVLPETAGISPVRRTISEYALTDAGWAFNLAALALAAGSLAVIGALILTRRATPWSPGTLLAALWAAALVVVVLFPKHNWAVGPSTGGHIHRAASVVAFLCLPLAVMLLTRGAGERSRRVPDRSSAARAAFWLAALSLVWFSPLVGALVVGPVIGTPWYQVIPLGLVERLLVMNEVLAVVALGVCALSASTRTPSPPPASPALIAQAA